MKKIILGISLLLAFVGVTPAQAFDAPTVVVIDSGFDSSKVDNVVLEVCVVSIAVGCNNNSGFEEGPDASGSSYPIRSKYKSDWDHGTIMANIVNQVNPDANIILLRNSKAIRGSVIAGNLDDFEKALEWVQANAKTYNIVAVSFSRGSNDYFKSSNNANIEKRIAAYEKVIATYKARKMSQSVIAKFEAIVEDLRAQLSGVVPCPTNDSLQSDIVSLQSIGVATIISAGNDGNRVNINEPACLEPSVAISTRSQYDNADGTANPTLNTNIGSATDFLATGTFNTVLGRVAESSSAATAAFAALWAANYAGDYSSTYDKIYSDGIATAGYAAIAVEINN